MPMALIRKASLGAPRLPQRSVGHAFQAPGDARAGEGAGAEPEEDHQRHGHQGSVLPVADHRDDARCSCRTRLT